jgi:hypothetical protein
MAVGVDWPRPSWRKLLVDPNRVDALSRALSIPSRRRVSRALVGVGLIGGLRSLSGGRDAAAKKKCKKCKKCDNTPRCPSGQILQGTVCATVCEVNEDCGGPPVFCHTLGDQSARVCIISDGSEPDELPPCPSLSSAECAAGQVCFDFAMAPVCGRAM